MPFELADTDLTQNAGTSRSYCANNGVNADGYTTCTCGWVDTRTRWVNCGSPGLAPEQNEAQRYRWREHESAWTKLGLARRKHPHVFTRCNRSSSFCAWCRGVQEDPCHNGENEGPRFSASTINKIHYRLIGKDVTSFDCVQCNCGWSCPTPRSYDAGDRTADPYLMHITAVNAERNRRREVPHPFEVDPNQGGLCGWCGGLRGTDTHPTLSPGEQQQRPSRRLTVGYRATLDVDVGGIEKNTVVDVMELKNSSALVRRAFYLPSSKVPAKAWISTRNLRGCDRADVASKSFVVGTAVRSMTSNRVGRVVTPSDSDNRYVLVRWDKESLRNDEAQDLHTPIYMGDLAYVGERTNEGKGSLTYAVGTPVVVATNDGDQDRRVVAPLNCANVGLMLPLVRHDGSNVMWRYPDQIRFDATWPFTPN